MAEYQGRLTDKVRAVIAIRINLGYFPSELADRYNKTTSGIETIARERSRWLPEGDIARTQEEKFRYAQRMFADDSSIADLIHKSSRKKLRKDIQNRLMGPVGDGIVERFDQDHQDHFSSLIRAIFGSYPVETSPNVYDNYLSAVRGLALDVLKHHASQGKLYDTIDYAVEGVIPDVREKDRALEHEYKPARERLKTQIDNALNQLTPGQKAVIELIYGLNDGYQKTPTSIVKNKLVDVKRQRVEQLRDKALEKLRESLRELFPEHLAKETKT